MIAFILMQQMRRQLQAQLDAGKAGTAPQAPKADESKADATAPATEAPATAPKAVQENLTPVSSAFMASWTWLKNSVRSAYQWTVSKLKAGSDAVGLTTGAGYVTEKVRSAGSWVSETVGGWHSGLKEKSEAYRWTSEKLNNARISTGEVVIDTVKYVVASGRFAAANLTFAGLWTLNTIDAGVLGVRCYFNDEEPVKTTVVEGVPYMTLKTKAGVERTVMMDVAALAIAPKWETYKPEPTRLGEALKEAAGEAGEVLKRACDAAKAGATAAVAAAATVMAGNAVAATPAPAAAVDSTSTMTAAPAVQQAQPVFQMTPDAIVSADRAVSEFFKSKLGAIKTTLVYNPAWGSQSNFYEGLINDPQARVAITFAKEGDEAAATLALGQLGKCEDSNGSSIVVLATRLGLVVVYEEGASGNYVYNADQRLAASGVLRLGGKSTLQDLQYILGAEGKPNLGEQVEQIYGAMLNAQPSAKS